MVDLWELVDFEFEVFPVSEAVSLTDEPTDFVVEALRTGVAEVSERPIAGDSVQPVADDCAIRVRNSDIVCGDGGLSWSFAKTHV